MKHSLIVVSVVIVLLGAGLGGCGGDDEAATTTQAATAEESETTTGASTTGGGGGTLQGSVGPGFEISIEGGSNLAPGRYTLVVDDKSSSHNFHLTGPGGVEVSTSVEAEGQQSFEVELAAGEYRFVCDPHASSMNGTFTVG